MRTFWNLGRLGRPHSYPHWSFLIALLWVAWTSLAAGAALALAVHAAFFILIALVAANMLFMTVVMRLARRGERRVIQPEPTSGPKAETPVAAAACGSPSVIVLPAHARADEMSRMVFARQSYFPVAQGREVVGVISKGQLLQALAQGQGDSLIVELINTRSCAAQTPTCTH